MKNRYLDLFLTFLKLGAFTFGGGYAMIALIEKEVVEKKKWITEDEILDIIGISESTPGPLAINSATFIGYRVGKVWGSILASLGVVIPSFLIITIISYFILNFKDNQIVSIIFKGIRAGVVVLIFNAAFRFTKKLYKDIFTYFILAFVILLGLLTEISVIFILLICALLGIIYYGFINTKKLIELSQEEEVLEDVN